MSVDRGTFLRKITSVTNVDGHDEFEVTFECGHKRRIIMRSRTEVGDLEKCETCAGVRPTAAGANADAAESATDDAGVGDDNQHTTEQIEKLKRWDSIATALGYNELAKMAETLGQKVFCRMARDTWEAEFVKLGGVIDTKTQVAGAVVLTLRERPPHIFLREGDIELMRAAVAAHDAKKQGTQPRS